MEQVWEDLSAILSFTYRSVPRMLVSLRLLPFPHVARGRCPLYVAFMYSTIVHVTKSSSFGNYDNWEFFRVKSEQTCC